MRHNTSKSWDEMISLREKVVSAGREDLLTEILYLKQQLADAHEERRIQVAIGSDEVADKQQLIEDLSNQ